MPAVTRSLISDDFKLGHGADDGEHCAPHRAIGVDLILDTDKPDTEMVEFLQSRQQVARAAGKAIELPDQHTIDFPVPSSDHERAQLWPAFSSP